MPKRILQGTVTSDQRSKTVTVWVMRSFRHPLYGKIVRQGKKYHAHDEKNACKIGDVVRIEESRPISKSKSWIVIENLGQAAKG